MLYKKYDLNVPTYCPKCDSELELDHEYEKTTLLCPNSDCDFKLDVTKEFEKAAKELDEELEQESFEERHGTPANDDYHRYVEEE